MTKTMRRTLLVIASIALLLASTATPASAWSASLTGQASRPCGNVPWTATFTVHPDPHYTTGYKWQVNDVDSSYGSYTQAPSGRIAAGTEFVFTMSNIPANVASVSLQVEVKWYTNSGSYRDSDWTNEVTVTRPYRACPTTTTTTSTTTTTTTTTTQPSTTTAPTTTVPETTTTTAPESTTTVPRVCETCPVPVPADPSFTG